MYTSIKTNNQVFKKSNVNKEKIKHKLIMLLSTKQQVFTEEKVTKLCDISTQTTVKHDKKSKTYCEQQTKDAI
eukprot:4232145-Ditylum_brightwellii.AAC.1